MGLDGVLVVAELSVDSESVCGQPANIGASIAVAIHNRDDDKMLSLDNRLMMLPLLEIRGRAGDL